MADETPVNLSKDEIGLLLSWMYRAQAAGPAATHLIKKFHAAKKTLLNRPTPKPQENEQDITEAGDDSGKPNFFL